MDPQSIARLRTAGRAEAPSGPEFCSTGPTWNQPKIRSAERAIVEGVRVGKVGVAPFAGITVGRGRGRDRDLLAHRRGSCSFLDELRGKRLTMCRGIRYTCHDFRRRWVWSGSDR